MKVTLFTSNNHRHNYLINLLSNFCDELWVIQECKTLFTGNNDEKYLNKNIKTGKFGANMSIEFENVGPVTIIIDSKNKI